MARDPYTVLGVPRDADAETIKRAYRRLAKKYHPDLNPGAADVDAKFKELNTAHDILADPEKRAKFDRGEIDAAGQERPERAFYRDHAGGPEHFTYAQQEGFADAADLESILSEVFGGRFRDGHGRTSSRRPGRGSDVVIPLTVPFVDAMRGGKRRITTADGSALEVSTPPGAKDGQMLRLAGKGMPGYDGGPPGDAYVEIRVEPHPFFERKDDDIHVLLPVTIAEALLGAKVRVPTIDGPVDLTVPKGSSTGSRLRLRGRGVPRPDGRRGDQYVRLEIVAPPKVDDDLAGFLRDWSARNPHNPRAAMERHR